MIQKIPYIGKWRKIFLKHSTPGDYSSPIPDIEYLLNNKINIFVGGLQELKALDLNLKGQINNLTELVTYYNRFDFPAESSKDFRYYTNNIFYRKFDAYFLFSLLLHLRPKNIIEVGSGYSSAIMLDTNEKFLDSTVRFTFIDPDTRRIKSILKPGDYNLNIIEKSLLDVDKSIFQILKANDIIFIDSSHVCKAGSELNYLIFEILPILNTGVLIHFHDVFYPFDYPVDLFLKKFYWNESYLLRSFLMYNKHFEIYLMNTFLRDYLNENEVLYPELKKYLNELSENLAGSLWLRKIN